MEFKFSQLSAAASEIAETNAIILNGFESDWNDEVHDSYGGYIEENTKRCQTIIEQINYIVSLSTDIESVDVDSLVIKSSKVIAAVEEL